MQKLIIFSSEKKIPPCFSKLKGIKNICIQTPENFKKCLTSETEDSFIYFNLASYSGKSRNTLRSYLKDDMIHDYGILDPDDEIEDPATLFFTGASDYISGRAYRQPLDTERINAALNFYNEPTAARTNYDETGIDWSSIEEGKEYDFLFIYSEIDILNEWKSKSGKKHIRNIMEIFYHHMEKVFEPLDGKIWIRTDYGGVLLVPLSRDLSNLMEACLKLTMNRLLTSSEIYPYNTMLTYRLALHCGRSTYQKEGNTGEVISQTVNYIFHLGQKHTQKDSLVCTKDVLDKTSDKIRDLFSSCGEYKQIPVFQADLPV